MKITTCHSTKGDEYEVVICTGLLNGKIPHWDDIIDCSRKHSDYTARRLLYVISSRAKKTPVYDFRKWSYDKKWLSLFNYTTTIIVITAFHFFNLLLK
ncbi:hypothetical protein LDO48_16615 [Pantoea agglomerans]|nr:hypothetical protein [Pantoea agglomerans]